MVQGGRMLESVDVLEVENHNELLPHHARSLPEQMLNMSKKHHFKNVKNNHQFKNVKNPSKMHKNKSIEDQFQTCRYS